LAIIAVFATQKLQQMLEKHYYEEFTCRTVKISFVLHMLLIQYLQQLMEIFPATDVLFNFTPNSNP